MKQILAFFVLGLGSGAIVGAIGVGVVLCYRASGVVNFAYGGLSLYVAYVFIGLRSDGRLVLPIGTIDLGGSMAFIPAVVISLVYAGLQSVIVYRLCFHPLHRYPPLVKVVASVGVMIVYQALIVLRFGIQVKSLAPILPSEPMHILGVTVPRDRIYLAGFLLVMSAVVAAWSSRTRFGKVTSAAAENEKAAVLLGHRPGVIAMINWLIGGVFAGVFAILIAPIVSLEAVTFTLLIVPALGAALVGRLSSLMVTAIAGLVLGGFQSVVLLETQLHSWLPQVGLKEGLPFVVVIVIVFFGGRRLPGRGTVEEKRLHTAPAPRFRPIPVAIALGATVAALLTFGPTWKLALITSMTGAVLCLSIVVLTGYVGQISLVQMSLAGVSGFALSRAADRWGIPFPLAPLFAIAVATAVGVLVGFPALRVRGIQLAAVSLAAAIAIEELVFKNPEYTGGLRGSKVPQPKLFGIDFGIRGGVGDFPRAAFGFFVLIVLALVAFGVARLRASQLGRRMVAVRDSERAAAAAGIDVARVKVTAVAISAAIAGVGGSLLGYQQGQLSYGSFTVLTSITLLTLAYIGGISTFVGGLIGGVLFSGGLESTALDQWLDLGRYESLILGLGLVLTVLLNPNGLAGLQLPSWRPKRAGSVAVTDDEVDLELHPGTVEVESVNPR